MPSYHLLLLVDVLPIIQPTMFLYLRPVRTRTWTRVESDSTPSALKSGFHQPGYVDPLTDVGWCEFNPDLAVGVVSITLLFSRTRENVGFAAWLIATCRRPVLWRSFCRSDGSRTRWARRTALALPGTPFSGMGAINHVNVFMNNKLIRFQTSCMYICTCGSMQLGFNPVQSA